MSQKELRAAARNLHKIPWDDPDFSERMLREHLSQSHDGASRRSETIADQVDWIEEHLLASKGSRVLDLGCGPGFYTERLAQSGHDCVGIDFSPASIAYARDCAASRSSRCEYVCEDVATADFGSRFDLVMMLFGELNMFRPDTARVVLAKARSALRTGGFLLLEVHPLDAVRRRGLRPARRYATPFGPFSDRAHIVHQEHDWDESEQAAHTSYFVIDAATSEVTPYGETTHGYSHAGIQLMLEESGFADVQIDTTFPGNSSGDLVAVIARASSGA